MIELVFITHNRLEYTRKALASVLAEKTEQFKLTIWDNASTDGTREYLRNEVTDSRIEDIVFSEENVGQVEALNNVWQRSKADLLGKLDNDCLTTPGWTRTLASAHKDIPKLGVVACWHFFEDDFDYDRAKHKIQQFGRHQILRHPYTCGTGFLIKRSTYEELGPMQGIATSAYWLSMARHGFINGFYYPLIFQEHMDDPKSRHSNLKDEGAFQTSKQMTFGINLLGVQTLDDLMRCRQRIIDGLLNEPWQPKYYYGWRGRIRRTKARAIGLLSRYKN